jgi:RNA polymerase sigma-70 factor (ECF subfamily)
MIPQIPLAPRVDSPGIGDYVRSAPMGEDDRVLVERAASGDGGAFEELVRRFGAKVYRLAYRLVRDPDTAQDVLQETFLAVHRNIGSFRFESAFSSWLYRVAYNTALMRLRKDRSLAEDTSLEAALEERGRELAVDLSDRADDIVSRRESLVIVQRTLDRLPEAYRTVFVLRDLEGMSTEEVADIMEITPATVKMRLHRARLALRDALSKETE